MITDILSWDRVSPSIYLEAKTQYSSDCVSVYAMLSADDEILYISYAQLIRETVVRHSRDANKAEMWSRVSSIAILEVHSKDEANALRTKLIRKYQPAFNARRTSRVRARPMPSLRDGAYLYQFSNAFGQLVYVGITSDITRRLATHRASSPWYREGLGLRIKLFTVRGNARAAEQHLIETFNPGGNKQHVAA